jgi:hypothetical protein
MKAITCEKRILNTKNEANFDLRSAKKVSRVFALHRCFVQIKDQEMKKT